MVLTPDFWTLFTVFAAGGMGLTAVTAALVAVLDRAHAERPAPH
ncbi:hypothetical protein O7599_03115 [Streptomyces sp. WMMC500]|nr:hypothetical protein [Streptomyces sp. WMMC500]WBB61561.1 hypothetical protein O7599_03115 [Streptomyces sp. WMMC500]